MNRTSLFDTYLLKKGYNMNNVLQSYITKHGQPPQPLLVVCNPSDKDTFIPPEGYEIDLRTEKWILPKVVFVGIEEKVEE